ncbi:MAG: glycine betaine/L-proline ABC transporter substrate-binding protein ProX [Acidimicrobiia bacterium]|nr:glycine betaine/L-proline ABC transporter substrate-binding protein ProX [Acidimicrobiia bacterium]
MTRARKVLALLAVFALLAVACGDDEPSTTDTQPPATVVDRSAQEAAEAAEAAANAALADAEAELEAAQMALEEAEEAAAAGGEEAQMALEEAQMAAEEAQKTAEEAQMAAEEAQMALEEAAKGPGAGVSVTMARANWSTGYMQAAIYAALLGELGYEVSDPADLELAPSNAYVSMATGEFDFWVNSWLPNHDQFLVAEMPDGSVVSDHVTRLGREMPRAGVQGLITNKAFADANGLTTLDAMLSDPEVFAAYESADASPGDGVLQIYGCPEGWGCHANINAWLENAGWDNIEQFDIGGYDAMIADAIAKDAAGEPYLVYTWAPSHYVSDLRPGDNAVWVSIHTDPSVSPTQIEGPTSIGNRCTTDPCLLGWDAADIAVIANNDFLAANTAAARLFELFTISPVDVALQNVRMQTGENTEDDIKRHAAEWITENRSTVDEWLAIAALPVDDTPGSGVSVTMARANWSTGYMQAAIYAALLGELGYEVSDPADLELAPSNAYVSMATGEFDFWVNSWLPNHDQFLVAEMPDGSVVSDHVTRLGREMPRAGVQGLITNKAFADANGLTTLDAMLSDPEVFAAYESADASPGDGVLQIYGCPEGWGCHANINAWLENAGWDNIEQFDIGGYDAMIADAIAKDAAGEPYLVYTWAPSHYVSDLRPGDNAVWVSIHTDPSVSPTQIEGPTSIGNRCTTDPCLLGWDAADIAVIANNDFLAANTAAARLFELFTISPVDVALQNVRMQTGENTEDDIKRHAAEWITENRDLADSWLYAARLIG